MATPYIWHPGSHSVNGQWPFHLDLWPDELLSSWLIRLALVHRCDPMSLTGSIWPNWRVWQHDPDRYIPYELVNILSSKAGVNCESIKAAFLSNISNKCLGGRPLSKGVYPWIMANGNRGRRHNFGRAVCPKCLLESPYLKIQWRLAWHTVCAQHETLLVDRCSFCQKLIQPHRLEGKDRKIATCSFCKSSLAFYLGDFRSLPTSVIDLQMMLDDVLLKGAGIYNGRKINAEAFFNIVRFFVSLIRIASLEKNQPLRHSLLHVGVAEEVLLPTKFGLRIELSAISDRLSIWRGVNTLLSLAPRDLFNSFHKYSMTSSIRFLNSVTIPPPFESLAERALKRKHLNKRPPTTSANKRPKTKKVVMQKWHRLINRSSR